MNAEAGRRDPATDGDVGMLLRQVRHEFLSLTRTPITLILSVGFPLLFFILLAALVGNLVIDPATDVRIVQFLAPGLASFGVVMATFSFLAVGLAEARATGVVKRQSGTPVPAWVLVGGRIGAAIVLAFVAVGLVLLVGWLFYDLQILGRSIVAIIVTLLVAAISFSACGLALALLLPNPATTLAVTNGIVIPLAFISDMFMFGNVAMPSWLTTIGWLFPLKHLVAIFADGLNPYLTGSGFQLGHLAAVAAWGVLGAAAGVWLLRRGRRSGGARDEAVTARVSAGDQAPRHTSAPSRLALVDAQFRHTQSILWRDLSSVFFAVAFPVILVAVIPTVNGGGDREMPTGQPLGTFFAATMAIYGAAVTAYVNMPQGLAEDRERGVLKRIRATPLPAWGLLAGRILGALVVSLITLAGIAVLTAVVWPGKDSTAWPGPSPRLARSRRHLRRRNALLRSRRTGCRVPRPHGSGRRGRGPRDAPAPVVHLRHLHRRSDVPAVARRDLVDLPAAARVPGDDRGHPARCRHLGPVRAAPRRHARLDPRGCARRRAPFPLGVLRTAPGAGRGRDGADEHGHGDGLTRRAESAP